MEILMTNKREQERLQKYIERVSGPHDIDQTARDLPRMTLHGNIPTATTMALAARVVELLARVAVLEAQVSGLENACRSLRERNRALGIDNESLKDYVADQSGEGGAVRPLCCLL